MYSNLFNCIIPYTFQGSGVNPSDGRQEHSIVCLIISIVFNQVNLLPCYRLGYNAGGPPSIRSDAVDIVEG